MLLTALILQFVAPLRGTDMFDPISGTVEFVEYGVFRQWGGAGLLGLVLLGVVVPLVANLLYLMSLGHDVGVWVGAQSARHFETVAGPAVLDVPLVVRKRTRRGTTVDALPLQVRTAASWRRALARLVDAGLVFFGATGAIVAGSLIETRSLSLPENLGMTSLALLLGVLLSLYLARWRAFALTGQSVGKLLLDVHVVTRDRPGRASARRAVSFTTGLRREVVPDLLTLFGALLGGMFAPDLGNLLLAQMGVLALFDIGLLRAVTELVGLPLGFLATEILLGLPLPFGRRSLRDWVGGTEVVRASVIRPSLHDGFLVRRVAARTVDAGLLLFVAALPWTVVGAMEHPPVELIVRVAEISIGLVAIGHLSLLVGLSWLGTTPGKRLFRLQVVDVSGAPVDSWVRRVLVREVMSILVFWSLLPFVAPLYDLLSALFDEEGRSLHDWIAGTRVVEFQAVPTGVVATE